MLTATTIHDRITAKIIQAIERGQCPPWRKPWRPDLDNCGFPCDPQPFTGIAVLLLNMAASEQGLHSKFWTTKATWEWLGGQVSGEGTIIPSRGDPSRWTTVFNGDQVRVGQTGLFRSRPRSKPLAVDYGSAEAVIKTSGADIRHIHGLEAAYYYGDDCIIFPHKWQFVEGPGGIEAYYDSLFHELAGHWTETRLGWSACPIVNELRAEIAAPFATTQLGLPVFADMEKLANHAKHLDRWVTAMKADPTLIFKVAHSASQGVDYLLSATKAAAA